MFKLLNILSKIVIKAYYKEAKCLQAKSNAGWKLHDKLKQQADVVGDKAQSDAIKSDAINHKADKLKELIG